MATPEQLDTYLSKLPDETRNKFISVYKSLDEKDRMSMVDEAIGLSGKKSAVSSIESTLGNIYGALGSEIQPKNIGTPAEEAFRQFISSKQSILPLEQMINTGKEIVGLATPSISQQSYLPNKQIAENILGGALISSPANTLKAMTGGIVGENIGNIFGVPNIGATAGAMVPSIKGSVRLWKTSNPKFSITEKPEINRNSLNKIVRDFKKTISEPYELYDKYNNTVAGTSGDISSVLDGINNTIKREFESSRFSSGKVVDASGNKVVTIGKLKDFMKYLDDRVKLPKDHPNRLDVKSQDLANVKSIIKDRYIKPRLSPEDLSVLNNADKVYSEAIKDANLSDKFTRDTKSIHKIMNDPNESTKREILFRTLRRSGVNPKKAQKLLDSFIEKESSNAGKYVKTGLKIVGKKAMGL